MAFAAVNDPVVLPALRIPSGEIADVPRTRYKSYKKKYLKLKYRFDKVMLESNNLYGEEQTLKKQARELQESNDQILDLLLEVNDDYSRLPSRYHFDISSPTPDASSVPALEPDEPTTSNDGDASHGKQQKDSKGYPDKVPRSLKSLLSLSHTTLESCTSESLLPPELDSEDPTGYYSPSHEASYLSKLDASSDLITTEQAPQPSTSRITDKDRDKDKDKERKDMTRQHELHNPVSAYNWLRKYQPQVFLQDHEDSPASAARLAPGKSGAPKASPKPRASPKPPTTKGTKRARESTAKKEEQEIMLDEDGTIIGTGGFEELAPVGAKGKRKRDRDDDNAYRPKGGSSRAPKKKKRVSGGDKERGSGTPGDMGLDA